MLNHFLALKRALSHIFLPRGPFSVFFGFWIDTFACILVTKGLFSIFWLPKERHSQMFWCPCGHFDLCFGSQEGNIACSLALQRTCWNNFLASKKGTITYFGSKERAHIFAPREIGSYYMCFDSQEGTLTCVFAPKRILCHIFWHPNSTSMYFAPKRALQHVLAL